MSDFSNNRAFIVGINNYVNGISPLQNAVNDAKKLIEILRGQHGYQVWVCLDEVATLSNLNRFIETTLLEQVGKNDRLLFYFAGHGIALNGESGPEGYLIPQDAKLNATETYLSMAKLQECLEKLPCRHFLGILDCCFAGAFRWSSNRDLLTVPEVIHQERYDRFITDPAWQVITSAASDQKALDAFNLNPERRQRGNHSPFAAALIEALAGKADIYPPATNSQPPGDGVITATELYLYLREEVEPATPGNRQRQTPGIWPLKKHDKGEYIFLSPGHPLNLPPAPPLDASKNPYRGLESFNEEHSELFFGRTELVEKLQNFVKTNPLTVVLGASGSGKSSLVKAGLIPKLRKEKTEKWYFLPPIRPGKTPLQALNNALKQVQLPEVEPQNPQHNLVMSIDVWAKKHPNYKLLLFIDQSEEIITLCQNESERKEFFQEILKAVNVHSDKLRVVLSLRSDFEPQVRDAGLKFVPTALQLGNTMLKNRWQSGRFIVPVMTRGELRDAIEKPAEKRVMYFQPHELVEQLIDEVADMPGALPLLSFALSELYLKYLKRQREAQNRGIIIDRSLTQEDYQDLGGVIQSLTQRANVEYEALVKENPAYDQIIRHVMLRMVAIGGSALARRQVPLSELEYPLEKNLLVEEVIKRFTDVRLLVKGQDADGNPYVEPAHDALVRGWQKLLKWKQDEEESLLLQRRLTPAAEEWESVKSKEQPSGFPALAETAIDWLDGRFYIIENLFNKIPAQIARLWRRKQNQQEGSREKPVQFLWDANPYLNVLDKELNSDDNWLNKVEADFVQESILQKRRNISWGWRITSWVILLLSVLISWAVINLRQSTINQMLTNTESADSNLRSNHLILDALVDSLSAGESLKNQWLLKVPPKEKDQNQVIRTLRKAVYTVREYNRQEDFPSGVQSIFWKKDGSLLVVSTENDGTVKVWDKHAKQLAKLPGNQYKVTQVIFSPNGSKIVIGTNNGTILFWDRENQQKATVLQRPQCEVTKDKSSSNSSKITSLNFKQDGSQLVSVEDNGIARLWNLSNNQCQKFQVPQNKIVTAGFQPDGKLLLVTTTPDGKTVSVFNSSLKKLNKPQQFSVSVDRVILSPHSEDILIAYGSSRNIGNTIFLWHWQNKNKSLEKKLLVRPDNISFSPDGKKLAVAEFNNGTIYLLDSEIDTIPTELKGNQGRIANFNFRPDGKVLATVSADGTLRLWTLEEQKLSQSQELPDKVNSLSFNRDGTLIATQAVDGTVRLLNLSGKPVQQFNYRYPVFNSLRFSPNGEQLATLSNQGTAGILDLSSQQYREFAGKYNSDSNLSFSPNGKQLAVTGEDHQVYLLDVSSGKPNDMSFPYEENISFSNVIWKSDDQILLSGVELLGKISKSIVLLDVKSGKQIQTISENLSTQYAFSGISSNNDGSLAAIVEEDGTVSLWYMDGTKLGKFKDPDPKIKSVILSPDSSMLATIGEDGTTKLWEIGKLNELLAKGCDRVHDYLQDNPNVSKSDHLCLHADYPFGLTK